MLDDGGLDGIARRTLADYDAHAVDFEAATRDHDTNQNIDALLRHIETAAPATILDFGCGPGRDLARFATRGHVAIGLDGSAAFVRMAQATGATVWHQDFFHLDLPVGHFDGIFANATLQHVPAAILPRLLNALWASLGPRGVLFASIPHGDGQEGWNGERYGSYHTPAGWRAFLSAAGFVELEHYYRPTGLPAEQQRWFASVWRKD